MTLPDHQQPRRKRLGLIFAVLALVVGVVGATVALTRAVTLARAEPATTASQAVVTTTVVAPVASPETFTAQGSLTLGLGHFSWDDIGSIGKPGPLCYGDGGFADIDTGTPVVITDAAGTVVAQGEIDNSIPIDFSAANTPTSCELRFSIADVPAGKGFYGVEVSHRGAVRYKEADLAEPVELSLGD